MMETLLSILGLAIEDMTRMGVVFLRIGTMAMLLPAFGERSLPVRLRLALAFCFTLIVTPLALPATPDLPPWHLLGTETMTGFLFGLLLRLFVLGLQTAGTIAAQSTSLSQMLGGAANIDPQPALGALLMMGGLCLAVILGLHFKLFAYMVLSYELVPAGYLLDAETVQMLGLVQVRKCFYLAFTLSAPFLLGAVIYNLILGFVNRAMPQLMVSFVGAPAVTLAGMVLAMISAPVMLQIWVTAMDSYMLDPGGAP